MEKNDVDEKLIKWNDIFEELLIEKLSDNTYLFREQLIEIVSRLPLVKGDLSINVIEWLITKLDQKIERYPRDIYSPITQLLGKTSDERILMEKLIPLLNSNNAVLRNNAYLAISKAERVLGKRFIKK